MSNNVTQHLGTRVDLPKVAPESVLAPAADRPLREIVLELKSERKQRFQAIAEQAHREINETTGIDITMRLTAETDAVVLSLWNRVFGALPEKLQSQVGLFALGGYGRGELNPASDLDLVAIVDGKIPDEIQEAWQKFDTALWDCGFQVGASCRALAELASIIKDDFVTATAVLECRPLAATEKQTDAVYAMLEKWRSRAGRAFLSYKYKEMESRWSKEGVSIYMNEPEVKTHPGCLRDIQLLRNAAFAALGSRNLHALRELGTFAYPDIDNLFVSNDHLLKVRSLLHFEHGHRQDVWLLADQLRLAELMGYESANRLSAVEHLLRDHYAMRRGVCEAVQLAEQRLRALGHLGRRFNLIKTRTRLNEDCVVIDRKVYLQRRDLWNQPDVLVRLMRSFRLAQQRRVRISLEYQKAIQQNLTTLRTEKVDPESAKIFFEILGERGAVAPSVRDLHGSGLLTIFIPEWQGLVCLKQWGTYHQYTVDEHTLVTLDHYDAVVNGDEAGLPMMRQILQDNKHPELFALALIVHDIGKFMGNGHVQRGALMVGDIATRLHMLPPHEELVHFLVLEHVTLSDASRMRDVTDPDLVGDIASRMGSMTRMSLLYALTYCDARAVGENILTGWQESLLFDLYRALQEQLTDSPEPKPAREVVEEALQKSGVTTEAIEQWLQQMPRAYPRQVTGDEAVWHYHTAQLLCAQQPIEVRVQAGDGGLTVAAVINRRGFLADCAAAFATGNLSVQSARIWRQRGSDLTFYHFSLNNSSSSQGDVACQNLERTLLKLANGETTGQELIRQTTQRIRRPRTKTVVMPPEVRVKPGDLRWIIDVRCTDRPGLLNALIEALEGAGLECIFTSVATYGDIARDVFYGIPMADEPDADAVKRALEKAAVS